MTRTPHPVRLKPEHDGVHDHDSVWELDWDGKARVVGNEHPTEKPVELFVRPIKKHTRVGDIMFEPFSGSGGIDAVAGADDRAGMGSGWSGTQLVFPTRRRTLPSCRRESKQE